MKYNVFFQNMKSNFEIGTITYEKLYQISFFKWQRSLLTLHLRSLDQTSPEKGMVYIISIKYSTNYKERYSRAI